MELPKGFRRSSRVGLQAMRCRDGTSSTDLALPGQVSSEFNVALGLAGVKGTSGCSMALLEGVFTAFLKEAGDVPREEAGAAVLKDSLALGAMDAFWERA